jgi:hypothetical protein
MNKRKKEELTHEALHTAYLVHSFILVALEDNYRHLPVELQEKITKLADDSFRLYQDIGKLL